MAPSHSKLQQEELSLIALLSAYTAYKRREQVRRKHRWWVHSLLEKRKEQGAYYNLVQELSLDGDKFQQYFRVTREQFTQVLFYVGEDLVKYSRCREVICPRQRLAICLR